ncbi:MAG: methyltransferase [Candidatus Micrarchaeaceae archaeon]
MLDIKIKCKFAYYPREDSELLQKAIEKFAFGKALDLGTGSGILGIAAAKRGCKVTFADIDKKAIEEAKKNAKLNNVKGAFIVSDLFSNISGKFNTIIFNPPYLYSKPIKELKEKRIYALDGGIKGREVINRFINEYIKHVEKEHIVLMLESSLNEYNKDILKLNAKVVESLDLFFEKLVVLKF